MTYKRLKEAVRGLLIGDNDLPMNEEGNVDESRMAALLEMAYIELSSKCTGLRQLTEEVGDNSILREGPGGTYLRIPTLPSSDGEVLDIDNELAPAVARILASYITKNREARHQKALAAILASYEAKVIRYVEQNAIALSQMDPIVADPFKAIRAIH